MGVECLGIGRKGSEEEWCFYLCQGVPRVEKGKFVPLETLDMLNHEGEVAHRLQPQLRLQRVQHVLDGGGLLALSC